MNSSKDRVSTILLFAMLAGIVLGVICGWVFGEAMLSIKFLGDIFMNSLKAVFLPLIMSSMIVGVAQLGDIRKLGAMGGATVIYYILTTTVAVIIGLIVSNIFQPGIGIDLSGAAIPEVIRDKEFSILELFMSLFPTNVFAHMANREILPVIVSSLLFGGVLTTLGEKGKTVISFFEGFNEVMMKIVKLIMFYAPIGVFALIAAILGSKGGGSAVWTQLLNIGKFVATVLTGLSIHAFIVIPLILYMVARRNPIRYLINIGDALTTAFSTASSAAALPLTMKSVEQNNKVSSQTTSFVLPIGATINMDGTALYEACSAIFIAQAYNISLTSADQIIIFLTATLASVGAAAIPHAGLITMVIVLDAVGLPLEGIGLIFVVDWFLDRCRTTVNVWGDSAGAAVVDHFVSNKMNK